MDYYNMNRSFHCNICNRRHINHTITCNPENLVDYNYEQKLKMFSEHQYSIPPPPCCTELWTFDSYIKYIDACGIWQPK